MSLVGATTSVAPPSTTSTGQTEVIEIPLSAGTYAVDLLGGTDRDDSVMAFVRLTKRR